MPGDAEATCRRLLDAGSAEFAGYGIAGARVDRIAAAARSNKAQIYHYFTSKDGLFDAVFDDMVVTTVTDVPITPDDLPGYAGRLHDSYVARPHVQRLAAWYRLERGTPDTVLPALVASNRAKVAAVADAQARGVVTDRFAAVDLLALVLHVSGLWSGGTAEFDALTDPDPAHRRAVVVDAVAALVGR